MKFLKKLACATAVAMSFAGAANAAVLNNWVFNPVGGGFESGQVINEYLDVNGNAFIQITPNGNTFSFNEHAVFNIVQADSNKKLFPLNYPGGNITATFQAFGTGTFGGAFQFTGGTIRMYHDVQDRYGATDGTAQNPGFIFGANSGTLIATFDVLGGGGNVDASGSPVNNGQVSVEARATQMEDGYFFRSNGMDLSMEEIMAFAFTNANTVGSPTANLVSEVACQYAGFTAACSGSYSNSPTAFFVSNNGQFKLDANEVPEPGSLALFGIALLGAGVMSRKRAKKA